MKTQAEQTKEQQHAASKTVDKGPGGTPATQRMTNTAGLPARLKAGVERLSGCSMEDVKVHYNSARPARLRAHAYTRGTDIYIAPGQEKHLPHEAWHVVQQKQGRVKPTLLLKGKVSINDDAGLEKEANVMGMLAWHCGSAFGEEGIGGEGGVDGSAVTGLIIRPLAGHPVIQRKQNGDEEVGEKTEEVQETAPSPIIRVRETGDGVIVEVRPGIGIQVAKKADGNYGNDPYVQHIIRQLGLIERTSIGKQTIESFKISDAQIDTPIPEADRGKEHITHKGLSLIIRGDDNIIYTNGIKKVENNAGEELEVNRFGEEGEGVNSIEYSTIYLPVRLEGEEDLILGEAHQGKLTKDGLVDHEDFGAEAQPYDILLLHEMTHARIIKEGIDERVHALADALAVKMARNAITQNGKNTDIEIYRELIAGGFDDLAKRYKDILQEVATRKGVNIDLSKTPDRAALEGFLEQVEDDILKQVGEAVIKTKAYDTIDELMVVAYENLYRREKQANDADGDGVKLRTTYKSRGLVMNPFEGKEGDWVIESTGNLKTELVQLLERARLTEGDKDEESASKWAIEGGNLTGEGTIKLKIPQAYRNKALAGERLVTKQQKEDSKKRLEKTALSKRGARKRTPVTDVEAVKRRDSSKERNSLRRSGSRNSLKGKKP